MQYYNFYSSSDHTELEAATDWTLLELEVEPPLLMVIDTLPEDTKDSPTSVDSDKSSSSKEIGATGVENGLGTVLELLFLPEIPHLEDKGNAGT